MVGRLNTDIGFEACTVCICRHDEFKPGVPKWEGRNGLLQV
jgi:hypothetical protein